MIHPIVIFLILLPIAIFIVVKINRRSAASISTIVKELDIPSGTSGFLSGHSIFTKNYVFLMANEFIFVPNGDISKSIRTRYEEISSLQLRGWLLLRFRIRTRSSKISVHISPISRFAVLDRRTTNAIDAGEMSTGALDARSNDVIVASDTVSGYMRYTEAFHDFSKALNAMGINKDLIKSVSWGWASIRRIISTIVISLLLFGILLAIVLIATDSTIKF